MLNLATPMSRLLIAFFWTGSGTSAARTAPRVTAIPVVRRWFDEHALELVALVLEGDVPERE
jgi:hypothetical protein